MKKYIITLLFCTLFCHLGIAQGLKSVSILGDSYSTFEGYVQPDTNFVWYLKTPPKGRNIAFESGIRIPQNRNRFQTLGNA